jgi:putative SOS response-associated peptidase YedK
MDRIAQTDQMWNDGQAQTRVAEVLWSRSQQRRRSMCNNYAPTRWELIEEAFGLSAPSGEWLGESWPDYMAPIVRTGGEGQRESVLASFGLVPKDRIPISVGKFDTTNARSETIGERRTFKGPWTKTQFALAPMTAFYEPNYEHGTKSVRYRIWLKDEPVFAVACLWREWPDGFKSFTMLTVNAEDHPLMRRMHAPNKEKRSIVIIPREQWDDWLECRDVEVARSFLTLYPSERMDAAPAPRPTKG